MGGFSCPCGHSFKDYEGMSYKARLIADQDFEVFISACGNPMERGGPYGLIAATVYQCEACQRLLLMPENKRSIYIFAPEGHSENLLGSVRGVE